MYGFAQATRGLVQFPAVTIQALGEHDPPTSSVLRGKFTAGGQGLAWVASGPQLEVVDLLTGARLSAYRFSGVKKRPPVVVTGKVFSWQKRTGLLIGLEGAGDSILCLYDLGLSRVLKAVLLPGSVTAVEPIIGPGGDCESALHPSLRQLFGVAAVVTAEGQVLLVDLCLDDLSCCLNEGKPADLEVIAGFPADVPLIREGAKRRGHHLCFQLVSPVGVAISTLSYLRRTNQLAVGYADGRLALWSMQSLRREHSTQLAGGVPVSAITFQEPRNDPQNRCYVWAVQSAQDKQGEVLRLHLLQLVFGGRKCLAPGQVLYDRLEDCQERFTLDLTDGMFPLGEWTGNTKLLGCQSIEKFSSPDDRHRGLGQVQSPDTSISVFTWQVKKYGQEKPSVYLGLFDINCWYHAQMPGSLQSGEHLQNCSYFALWSLDSAISAASPHYILDILVLERSLSRGILPLHPPPEKLFNSSTYNFDATCLFNVGVVHITCSGIQKEALSFLKQWGPSLSEHILAGNDQPLVAGLLSPRLRDLPHPSLSQKEQLEAILSAVIHTSSLGLLTGCIQRWATEKEPHSVASIHFTLEWTWNKVILTKEEFDRACMPLFDGSCHFIDPQTLQSIQRCHSLLSNLSSILRCFVKTAHTITHSMMDLNDKYEASRLICQYAQVTLWFSHSGLLPEGLDNAVRLPRLCYNYPVFQNYYTSRRQQCEHLSRGRWDPDCLMIDDMVSQLGDRVEQLWKRDEQGAGKYPPSSLHALLDIYLLKSIAVENKYAVTIYWLLDIMYSFPNKTDAFVESFSTAFAISWGHVKCIQGFWLIDHNDYECGLNLLLHPGAGKPESWQHSKIVHALLGQGEHRQALRYIRTMKPSVCNDSDVILQLTVLLFNRCMLEAWRFLRQHSTGLNIEELLEHMYKICEEMGLLEDLLKLPFTDTEQACLVRFLKSSTSVESHEFLFVHHLQNAHFISALTLGQALKTHVKKDTDPRLQKRSLARNSIVNQYGKTLPRIQRKLATERAKPYRRLPPSSVLLGVSQPKPLSAALNRAVIGDVLTSSTFINNALSKIGELWTSREPQTSLLAFNRPEREPWPVLHSLSHPQLPGTFVGTPISHVAQKVSRLLDGIVHPVSQLSECGGFIHQTSPRFPLCFTSSPLPKAKTLAMSVPSSGFTEFTPQSIQRSGLQTTPLPSPSVPPSRTSQDVPSQRLEKLEVSKENSNASSGSDQTTSDYQDAPLVEDFEAVFMTSQPANSSTESITTIAGPTEKGSDMEALESEVTPLDSEKQMGMLGDADTKGLLTAEESPSEFSHLSPTQGVGASLCVPSIQEGKILTPKSEVPVSEEEEVSTVRAAVADTPGDDRSSGPILPESPVISEHRLEQTPELALNKDHEREAEVLKANVGLPEEKPPMSDEPPDAQDVPVTEHEKLDFQEARSLSCQEYPSGTLKLQRNSEMGEQQVCDLPDNRDSAECDIAEVDGDLLVTQCNSTLTSEGEEGQVETGDSAAPEVLTKAANTTTVENDDVAKLPSIMTSDQESQKIEMLPYVPESIKVASAGNVLDATQDTSSKAMASGTMEQPIHEHIPLMDPELVKSTFQTVQETSTIDVSQVDDIISSGTCTRGRVQNLDVPPVHPEESGDVATPEVPGLSVMKKTRKTKDISKASKSTYSDTKGLSQPIPPNPLTARRGKRKRQMNQDVLECIRSMAHPTSRSSRVLEASTEGTSLRKEVKPPSVRKTTPKRMETSVETQECVEIAHDVKVSQVTNPSRSTRKRRGAGLQASEDKGREQDGKPSEQRLPVQCDERVTKGDGGASDVIKDAKRDSPQLALQAEFDVPVTLRECGRPRKVHPSQDVRAEALKEDRSPKKSKAFSIQTKSSRKPPATSKSTGIGKPALGKSGFMPRKESVGVMSSNRKRTRDQGQRCALCSRGEQLETCTNEEMMNQAPDFSEPKRESLFSPPVLKRPRREKAKTSGASEQPNKSASGLPSQLTASLPARRAKRRNMPHTPECADQLQGNVQSIKSAGKPKVRRVETETKPSKQRK